MIKRFFIPVILAAVLPLVFFSCSDSDGGDGIDNSPKVVLTADDSQIPASGTHEIKFTVKADGVDVTTQSVITNTSTGETLSGAKFSTTEPGQYTFRAVYNETTSNEYTITAISGNNFMRKVAVFQFTGTWCGYCPYMVILFDKVFPTYPEGQVVTMSFHTSQGTSRDPFHISETNALGSLVGIGGYPAANVDMRTTMPGRSESTLKGLLTTSLNTYPAECGIAISTVKNSASVDVEVKVQASEANDFKLVVVLLEDELPYTQKIYNEQTGAALPDLTDYVHNNVVRNVLPNINGDDLGSLDKGQEVKKVYNVNLDRVSNPANCRVVAYVLYEKAVAGNSKWMVNNIQECPVGQSVDYSYVW